MTTRSVDLQEVNVESSNVCATELAETNLEDNELRSQYQGSERYTNKRVSLLGKPIVVKQPRQDLHYRRAQAKIYNFLERPKSWKAVSYHVIVFGCVFICLIFSVLSTIPQYDDIAGEVLFYMEMAMLFWLFTEYCLRMWSAGCRSKYQLWRGRLEFAKRPFCVVDIIVIVASIIVLALGSDRQMFAASALRGLRFFQILRMIRMDRRGGSWKLLGSVVWAHRQELFTTMYMGFLGLVLSSFLMYLVEKDDNPQFRSYADALWWGVITLCTVGYGDAVPASWMGKFICACSCLMIISFFALTPGILGSGFALKVQQHQRHKHLIRRRVPAARLIQCLWRCYAADPDSTSKATWMIHIRKTKSPQRSRFPTMKRRSDKVTSSGTSNSSPPPYTPMRRNALNSASESVSSFADVASESTVRNCAFDNVSLRKQPSIMSNALIRDEDSEITDEIAVLELQGKHKVAIRFMRKAKFAVAKREFRKALRPYDVKDVIEQYSAGHLDMLSRIKILQGRLDQILGRQGGKDKSLYESDVSLATRIVNVEYQASEIDLKLDALIATCKARLDKQRQLGLSDTPPSTAIFGGAAAFLDTHGVIAAAATPVNRKHGGSSAEGNSLVVNNIALTSTPLGYAHASGGCPSITQGGNKPNPPQMPSLQPKSAPVPALREHRPIARNISDMGLSTRKQVTYHDTTTAAAIVECPSDRRERKRSLPPPPPPPPPFQQPPPFDSLSPMAQHVQIQDVATTSSPGNDAGSHLDDAAYRLSPRHCGAVVTTNNSALSPRSSTTEESATLITARRRISSPLLSCGASFDLPSSPNLSDISSYRATAPIATFLDVLSCASDDTADSLRSTGSAANARPSTYGDAGNGDDRGKHSESVYSPIV